MGAKAKLESLTNSWYGFAVFSAALGLLKAGISIWHIITGFVGLMFSFAWIWFWGSRLQKKASWARLTLVLFSALFTLGSAVNAARMTWAFMHVWELKLIAGAVYSAVYGWMMAKSFRTLTDSSVKLYFER